MAGYPFPGQVYPGQTYPGQVYPGQNYPQQVYPAQTYPGQVFPGQTFSSQVYPAPGQVYPAQMYSGQVYPGQMYPGQVYPGQISPGSLPSADFPVTFSTPDPNACQTSSSPSSSSVVIAGPSSSAVSPSPAVTDPTKWPVISNPQQFSWRFGGERYEQSGYGVSPNGIWAPELPGYSTHFVSCKDTGKLVVWDQATGQVQRTLDSPAAEIMSVIKSGGREILASSGQVFTDSGSMIQLFDLSNNGQSLHRFEKIAGLTVKFQSISFLPSTGTDDLQAVAAPNGASSKESTAHLFDLRTGLLTQQIPLGFIGGAFVKADLDTPCLFYAHSIYQDRKVALFDTRLPSTSSGPVRSFLGMKSSLNPDPFSKLSCSGSGANRQLLSWDESNVRVWDVGTGRTTVTLQRSASEFLYAGMNDHALVAFSHKDNCAHIWMLNGAIAPESPSQYSLVNAGYKRNSFSIQAATINGKSLWVCPSNGILEGEFGDSLPRPAW